MQQSLSWIAWLDRLNRVLEAARNRLLVAIDRALSDSAYEAAELLSPSKRRA
jgi:hypothetical protein